MKHLENSSVPKLCAEVVNRSCGLFFRSRACSGFRKWGGGCFLGDVHGAYMPMLFSIASFLGKSIMSDIQFFTSCKRDHSVSFIIVFDHPAILVDF